jgi:16S rRNA (guanine527-N7)-methyltransferase
MTEPMTQLHERCASLATDAKVMGVSLDALQVGKLERLAALLMEWNQRFNLTAIKEPAKIYSHHLLDSLSAWPELVGQRIADVGTGAGFPGLPLAIADPARQFTLIDSVAKKLGFVDQVVRELELVNVLTRHARVEQLQAEPFDTVIARAFAPLPRMAQWLAPLCNRETRVIAMKGIWPPAADENDAAPLPAGWRIESVRRVQIPGLDAERHLLTLRRTARLPDPA